jgi:hypothetical protein
LCHCRSHAIIIKLGAALLFLQCHVNYSRLTPQDMLRLLKLLAGSQTRPNNIWWQSFLSTLQVRITSPQQRIATMCCFHVPWHAR